MTLNWIQNLNVWMFKKCLDYDDEISTDANMDIFISVQGLEDQLLSVIVKYERPELEQRREALIQDTRWRISYGE